MESPSDLDGLLLEVERKTGERLGHMGDGVGPDARHAEIRRFKHVTAVAEAQAHAPAHGKIRTRTIDEVRCREGRAVCSTKRKCIRQEHQSTRASAHEQPASCK